MNVLTSKYILTTPAKLLMIILAIAALFAVWLIVSGLNPLASRRTRKNVKRFENSRNTSKKDSTVNELDDAMYALSKKLVPHIHLDKIERSEMDKALRISNMVYTPEEYKAYMWTVTGIFAAIGGVLLIIGLIFRIMIFDLLGVGIAIIGAGSYFLNSKKMRNNQRKAMDGIEGELPRFVAFIKTNLASNNESILSMLERYTANSEVFTEQMKQTIADAKTSNFDGAMSRWDQRVNSDKLKMVVHGLISANNGDNVEVYFAMLEKDLREYEIHFLKQSVKTIPNRMRLPKGLMYATMAIALFFPLIMQIVGSFKDVFMS